jgi:hypothetical protein
MPTTPATMGPEFRPMRMDSSRAGTLNCASISVRNDSMHAHMARAIRHARSVWRAVGVGQPPTTMYTSPTVST